MEKLMQNCALCRFLRDGESGFCLVSGYIPTSKVPDKNKFEFGPMNSTINGNAIEGAVSVWEGLRPLS